MKRPHWLKFTPSVILGLLVTGVAGLGWLVVCLPQWQTASLSQKIKDYETSTKPDPEKLATLEKGRIDTENAIRAALIQGFGGTAVLIGIYFAYRNLKVAEDKQVTERFSTAVEMLSSSSMHTRLGGIYALERIADDSDKDYPQVMEVLTAFVREESPYPPKKTHLLEQLDLAEEKVVFAASKSEVSQSNAPQAERSELGKFIDQLPTLRTDIQAAMSVIGRRKHGYGAGGQGARELNLQQTNLQKLMVGRANLAGVNLWRAHLKGAFLRRANLREAYLQSASLERASLVGANLEGAWLCEANLEGSLLEKANLKGANLKRANLSQVDSLTQGQLNEAITDEYTILPDYLLVTRPQI